MAKGLTEQFQGYKEMDFMGEIASHQPCVALRGLYALETYTASNFEELTWNDVTEIFATMDGLLNRENAEPDIVEQVQRVRAALISKASETYPDRYTTLIKIY